MSIGYGRKKTRTRAGLCYFQMMEKDKTINERFAELRDAVSTPLVIKMEEFAKQYLANSEENSQKNPPLGRVV